MKRFLLMIVLCFVAFVNSASSPPVIDFSELDKLVPTELSERITEDLVVVTGR